MPAGEFSRGVALRGQVWAGGDSEPFDGVVILDSDGVVAAIGPADSIELPHDLVVLGDVHHWISPGVIDAHVHLGLANPGAELRGGLVGVRDLGASTLLAGRLRTLARPAAGSPAVAVAGPVLTVEGAEPGPQWSNDALVAVADRPAAARALVRDLVAEGVDLVKVAVGARTPTPTLPPQTMRAVVDAAHAVGLPVTAHALSVDQVTRALDAGVDELSHVPTERLPEQLIDRIAADGVSVISTLQTFFSAGIGVEAARNAAGLFRAGVPLRYGTDLGNTGTRAGVDPRELDRLADAGLGRLGALRAATEGSARAYGVRGRTGRLVRGEPAALVLLSADPLIEPGAWRNPVAVVADGRIHPGLSVLRATG